MTEAELERKNLLALLGLTVAVAFIYLAFD